MYEMYEVFDSYGQFVKRFIDYIQASNYKYSYGNTSWEIRRKIKP